ncbi:hypothetical protein L5515_015764 [Caenorhabditis briggsae]|uniref:MATH domain-containing protein n=1 Tax=Caenorhabditis briggsae TaxID=6238 RepID=A0AAE9ECK7_CAEBR|nr:hypothetical protein L5515_015764 [Caenorhabditis briggsae]
MSDDKEKKFVYKHVFENMRIACYLQGPKEKHFGVSWQLKLYKDYYDGIAYFIAYFNCESLQTGNWSINTTCDIFVNGKPFSTGENFRSPLNRWDLSKNDIQKYGIDDSATIEVRVKINEMTGLFRDFDDYFAKESSDVVLTLNLSKIDKMSFAGEKKKLHVLYGNTLYLECLHSEKLNSWFVEVDIELRLGNEKDVKLEKKTIKFASSNLTKVVFEMEKNDLDKYLIDGNLIVALVVKINKSMGIRYREHLDFGKNKLSDVILIAGDRKSM